MQIFIKTEVKKSPLPLTNRVSKKCCTKYINCCTTDLINIENYLRFWVEALPASVGVQQRCTAPFPRRPPSRPPARRPPTPPLPFFSLDFTVSPSPNPHLLETWDSSEHTKLFHGQIRGRWQICHFWGQPCHIYRSRGRPVPDGEMRNERKGRQLSEHLLRADVWKTGSFTHFLWVKKPKKAHLLIVLYRTLNWQLLLSEIFFSALTSSLARTCLPVLIWDRCVVLSRFRQKVHYYFLLWAGLPGGNVMHLTNGIFGCLDASTWGARLAGQNGPGV